MLGFRTLESERDGQGNLERSQFKVVVRDDPESEPGEDLPRCNQGAGLE